MEHPIYIKNNSKVKKLPDKAKAEAWVEDIFYWLFSVSKGYLDNFKNARRITFTIG